MTSTEAAALRDLVLQTEAAVPAIDPRRLAQVYVAIRANSERETPEGRHSGKVGPGSCTKDDPTIFGSLKASARIADRSLAYLSAMQKASPT